MMFQFRLFIFFVFFRKLLSLWKSAWARAEPWLLTRPAGACPFRAGLPRLVQGSGRHTARLQPALSAVRAQPWPRPFSTGSEVSWKKKRNKTSKLKNHCFAPVFKGQPCNLHWKHNVFGPNVPQSLRVQCEFHNFALKTSGKPLIFIFYVFCLFLSGNFWGSGKKQKKAIH